MKITLEPTAEITTINGVHCRCWKGLSDKGTVCYAFLAAIAVPSNTADELSRSEEFSAELHELFSAELHELFPDSKLIGDKILEIDIPAEQLPELPRSSR